MSTTPAQRLAQAEATARRWRRAVESMAVSDVSDDRFCLVHRAWQAAELAVRLQREGAAAPPHSQRS